jgi:hypothetical protein
VTRYFVPDLPGIHIIDFYGARVDWPCRYRVEGKETVSPKALKVSKTSFRLLHTIHVDLSKKYKHTYHVSCGVWDKIKEYHLSLLSVDVVKGDYRTNSTYT